VSTEQYGVAAKHAQDSSGELVGSGVVSEDERARYVRGMFDAIAQRYDLINTLLSGGLHRRWKRATVSMLDPSTGGRALDVCCGTGDLAFLLARRVGPTGTVLGLDVSEGMLSVARRRADALRAAGGCRFVQGDAEALPFPDASFDTATIGFGIRNVGHVEIALREIQRVLRPGGRLAILEFSRPTNGIIQRLYDWYSFAVVPRFGGLVAGHRDAYLYLPTSIRRWPDQARFAEVLTAGGFVRVRYRNLLAGIAAIHTAARPSA